MSHSPGQRAAVLPHEMAEIRRYYTDCWCERFERGHNPRSRAIHYGLAGDGHADREMAKLKVNDVVAEHLALDSEADARLADFGCGIGGTAVHLAWHHKRWIVHALDATTACVELARAYAAERGVADRVHVTRGVYPDTPWSPPFDGAYAIETLCHSPHRRAVLEEVHRLLRPGARFVVADFFRTRHPLSSGQSDQYEVVKKGFRIFDYYDADLVDLGAEFGLSGQETDYTAEVLPALRRSKLRTQTEREDGESQVMAAHNATCVALCDLVEAGAIRYRVVNLCREA